MPKPLAILLWLLVAGTGAWCYSAIARSRGEALNSGYLVVAALCTYAIGYRFYSKWIAARVLALDDRQVAAMANLAQVRRAQGRDAEARAWEQRRAALEPQAPFHFLRLGQAALAAGDLALARAQFQRELRSQPGSHEAWFGLARVHVAQGDNAQAEQALRQALAASATAGEQARYAGKLGALRAAASH